MCWRASQKSAVLLMVIDDGSLISMTNNVRAMANTPSEKASSREFSFVSDIFCHIVCFMEDQPALPPDLWLVKPSAHESIHLFLHVAGIGSGGLRSLGKSYVFGGGLSTTKSPRRTKGFQRARCKRTGATAFARAVPLPCHPSIPQPP